MPTPQEDVNEGKYAVQHNTFNMVSQTATRLEIMRCFGR